MTNTRNQQHCNPFPEKQRRIFTCPCCDKKYNLNHLVGLYGLHPTDFDDIFITILCNDCTDVVTAKPSDPRRLTLKNELEQYFREPIGHRFHQAIALTSLKILEIHSGDIKSALEIGWPFPKAMHHYHVAPFLDGGIVMVCEKETGDA